ncbi:MAG TPA: 3-hydroxyacyl-CoA dehydrogenase [Burkholderiaceae bacterium]
MTAGRLENAAVLVVGAGIMGAGIAQVAAVAGHRVWLFDSRDGAAAQAKARLREILEGLAAKGRLGPDAARDALARIEAAGTLEAGRDARLVIEAIVEDLEAKRALFRQLEAIVPADCVLATNTSSISVTALANGLAHPERLVGMHFFNPVPLMKLVEVVSGVHTQAEVAGAIFELAGHWGKVPVHARSTPGFIVNRIARPYYAETLALLQEQAASPEVLDACLRGAGFRMGPCELMDLIGHDTNFAVTQSVYAANFYDKRYVPSLVQREMVDGGLLGRKTGRGFYRYPDGAPALPAPAPAAVTVPHVIAVHGDDSVADWLEAALRRMPALTGRDITRRRGTGWDGLELEDARLVLTDGRCANALSIAMGMHDVAVFDRPLALPAPQGTSLAFATADAAGEPWRAQAAAWLAALGFAPRQVADAPGLVVARTVAMLINEAADAVQQGVCTPDGADAAMKLGMNYPAGPFEWLAQWSADGVVALLDGLDTQYRGERYRASPWLIRRLRSA